MTLWPNCRFTRSRGHDPMRVEASEAPEAVARFLQHNGKALRELGQRLRKSDPPVVITSARGSSDHAAGYLKYLVEIALGIPCASVGASVASVYGAPLKVSNGLAVTISQSGKSPDIVALQEAAKASGALTVALVNVENSPAATTADVCLPLCAGPEQSVAATKTFIVSLVAAACVVAHWRNDAALLDAIQQLPDQLQPRLRAVLAKFCRASGKSRVTLCARARTIFSNSGRNGIETERDVRASCRGLFRSRSHAWSARIGGTGFSASGLCTGRRRVGRNAGSRGTLESNGRCRDRCWR